MPTPKPRPAAASSGSLSKSSHTGNPLLGGASKAEAAPEERPTSKAPSIEVDSTGTDPARPARQPPRNARTGVQPLRFDPSEASGEPVRNIATRLPVDLIRRVRIISAIHDLKQRAIYSNALEEWSGRAQEELNTNGFLSEQFVGDLSGMRGVELRNVSSQIRASLLKFIRMTAAETELNLQVIYYAALRDYVDELEAADAAES